MGRLECEVWKLFIICALDRRDVYAEDSEQSYVNQEPMLSAVRKGGITLLVLGVDRVFVVAGCSEVQYQHQLHRVRLGYVTQILIWSVNSTDGFSRHHSYQQVNRNKVEYSL